MAQPTALEQEMLELVNRMRTNPAAELDLLTNSNDAQVNAAIDYFDVNLNVLKNQWNNLDPAQPIAWSSSLNNAASKHNDRMIAADKQSHQLSGEAGLGSRITDAGYKNWSNLAENVFAYSDSVFYGHAGFAIDWGNTSTGIQNPAGHRNNIMSDTYREVGIDITAENKSSTRVGPYVITQDFGNRRDLNNRGWLLGVVYEDKDSDKFYDAGEGLGNFDVSITGINGTSYTKEISTMNAGGYQVLLDPGTYQVDFWQNGSILNTQTATVDDENIKIDLLVSSDLKLNTPSDQNNTNSNTDLDSNNQSVNDQNQNNSTEDTVIDEYLLGTHEADTLVGGAGNDTVVGRKGDDLLKAGDNQDWLFGGRGDDTLYGGGGDDSLKGQSGNDTVIGGRGDDTVVGNLGDDQLVGGRGDDLLIGERGEDTLIGVDTNSASPGKGTIDILRGGNEADLLILGDRNRVYYDDKIGNSQGLDDYALIQGMNLSEDVIQLHGSQSDYVLKTNLSGLPTGKAILRAGDEELIAVVKANSFSLDSDAVVFV